MGILRHLERNGGSIQPRLVQSASAESLTAELRRFKPDVLHVIGHGRWFPLDDCVKLQLYGESGAATTGSRRASCWACSPKRRTHPGW